MPRPHRARPRQLHNHQAYGSQPDPQSARQRLSARSAQGRRLGRRVPRKPHQCLLTPSLDCPGLWYYHLGLALRRFLEWLAIAEPTIVSFAAVTRDHALGFLEAMATQPQSYNGRPLQPLAPVTRRARTSALGLFFRETAAMGWDGVRGRPLLDGRDQPRPPMSVPRFIPADELAPLMTTIAALDCPFQRAALLTTRWCGARRGEIQRLAIDALDRYPDGTARLRIPAGKTYRERMVPLHEDAAEALRQVVALRAGGIERAFVDD